jgi:NAD(P)-dependent dehydrogenase (short-subunit alcohol dehydrogenase family)
MLTHLPCVLYFASNEYVKEKVSEAVDHLDESVVESLAVKYLEDMKAGRAAEKWTFPHHYKESKLCLNTYTRILAGELEERGEDQRILVNALCPGLFSSDMSMGALAKIDPEIVKQIIAQ